MPKFNVLVSRPTSNGWERVEIGNTLIEICTCADRDPEVQPYIVDGSISFLATQKFPTDCARNSIVKTAQDRRADFLMMIDVDGAPAVGTFKSFFTFLRTQQVPSVVGAPYVAADGEVQVFHWTTQQQIKKPLDSFALTRYNRDLAATKTGFERVASMGTHCVMFDMRVFGQVPPPYFRYQYADASFCDVRETEDCWCMRQFFHSDIPMFVDWDHPAAHFKELPLKMPHPLALSEIPEFYKGKMRSLEDSKPKNNLAASQPESSQ